MTKINKTAIVLDTNAFGNINKYNFEQSKIAICTNSFKNLNNISVFIPSIVIEELKKHIKESIKLSREKVESIYLKNYIDDSKINEIYDVEIKKLTDFLTKTNVIVIDCNKFSNLEEINKWYFSEQYPFEKSKPKEFPDAMILSATKEFLKDNYDNVYFISDDEGMKEAIKRETKYNISNDIGEIMERLLGIKEFEIRNCEGYIRHNDILKDVSIYNLTATEEAEYEIDEINYDIKNIEIIDKEEDCYLVCVDAKLNIKGEFTLLDLNMSLYDREDPECSVFYYRSGKEIIVNNHSIFLALYFDKNNIVNKYENVEVNDIDISKYFSQLELID